MTFLAPAMLWSLVLLVPLAAIYFLKVRPRRKPTTAYFLWERIFQEKRASSLFHRLRDAWSLVLMALAAAAVCLALGRPEWADERKDLLIVIDNSASMAAREGRASRLDLAKRLAGDIVQGLNGNQRAAIATAARQLSYHSHLTENPRELLEAIEAIQASSEPLQVESLPAAMWEQKASTRGGAARAELDTPIVTQAREEPRPVLPRDHRVLLVSDGAWNVEKLPAHVELIKLGTPLENVGLVSADMAYLAGGTSRLGFFYQTASTFPEPQKVDLTLWSTDEHGKQQLLKVIPLTIQPGTNPPETFQLADAPAGRWVARLDTEDALASDNAAYLAVAKPEAIRVAVESADPFFLENSVQAFSQGAGLLTLVTDKPQVVLAKSIAPVADFAVIFQPAGESVWWTELGEEVVAGPARVLVEDHPVLRHLNAGSIPFMGTRKITPAAGAQILVADDDGLPLIYKARHGGRVAVVVNMDPLAAEFYFSAWFPVLMHSAVTHLAGRENPLAAAYRPGEPVPIPGGRDDVVTKVAAPRAAGDDSPAPPTDVKGPWFHGLERLGFYTFENPSGTRLVGASLLAPEETLLNNDDAQSNHEPLSRGRSPAQWLTLLAIVALAAESILYHRRKVG